MATTASFSLFAEGGEEQEPASMAAQLGFRASGFIGSGRAIQPRRQVGNIDMAMH